MAFRNIMIENPATISVKNSQLIIKTDCEHSVAIEDISAVMLENRQSTITTAALSALGQRGCAVFMCDEKHMPCAVLNGFSQYCREYAVLKSQLHTGEVLKKHLWREIVVAKIKNQAKCLAYVRNNDVGLLPMTETVRSGDSGNVEATAAQKYFPALFGSDFTRSNENGINAGLNYGYAILRGYMARCLTVYGFLPALGLHHRSELNNFNLADDLMEPFRPVIDLLVSTLFDENTFLTPENKRMLFNCLNLDILFDGKHQSIAYAMELEVQSLSRSLSEAENRLILPELLELNQHSYE